MRYLEASEISAVRLQLNGVVVSGQSEPRLLASDFIRHVLGRTGTHVGCEHGVCGACTIRVDGRVQRACLTLAVQLDGAVVETVEGLAAPDAPLNTLQRAFRRHHALQCGFCTPGILITLTDLIAREPHADEARVREVLSGHLCRCTGYHGIVAAALAALAEARGHEGTADEAAASPSHP